MLDAVYIEITSLQHPGSSLLILTKLTSLCQLLTMAFLQFFTTAILLLGVTSVRTYSVPYDIQPAFSNIPRLIYTASESNPEFRGYSYTTQDLNGDGSNVVFTTGADSVSRLRNEMNSMKMPEKYSQMDMLDKTQENLISSTQQSTFEEVEENINKQDNFNSNIEVFNEEKKLSKNSKVDNNYVEHQASPQQVSFVSYPAFRENLLNLNLPAVFPRYQVSNVIQNQYYPHNPYARLELPLHNFDFYNPAVPLFHQPVIRIHDKSFRHLSITDEDIKKSTESHVTQNLQTNFNNSESNSTEFNIIKSRINVESTANTVEETSSIESATSMNKLESMINEKIKEKTISNESSAAISKNSVEQTTENKSNNNELTSTEGNPLSSTSTSTEKCKCETIKETSPTKI